MGLPEDHQKIREAHLATKQPMEACEREIIGTDHAELSAETCEVWKLPEPIQRGVRNHHAVPTGPAPSLAAVIGAADLAVARLGILVQDWAIAEKGEPVEALAAVGLTERAPKVLEAFQTEFEVVRAFFQ
jgi:HD-like signal output (HDOD) protein